MKAISLQIAAAIVALALAIPLTFFPLKWARAIGWNIPSDVALAKYFARCLGAVLLPLTGLAAYSAHHPALADPICATISGIMLIVAAVHVVGWLEKSQPLFETLEIGIYAAGGGYFLWLALQ